MMDTGSPFKIEVEGNFKGNYGEQISNTKFARIKYKHE